MGESSLLPFPMLVDLGHEACCRCGYSLEGIAAPGVCPECGLGFDDGVSALMVHGVPREAGGPRWRKAVWVLIAVGAFVFVQGMVLWIKYPLLALGWLGMVVGASVAMAMTNTQRRTGTEVIVFSRFGISHWPMKKLKKSKKLAKLIEDDGGNRDAGAEGRNDRMFTPWQGTQRGVSIKRISSYWSRLKIRSVDEFGKERIELDTGFRCQAGDIPMIERVIDRLAAREWIDDLEGVELISAHDGGMKDEQGYDVVVDPASLE